MVISTNLWRLDRQSDGYAKIGDKWYLRVCLC